MRIDKGSVCGAVVVAALAAGMSGQAQTAKKSELAPWKPSSAAVRVEDYAGPAVCAQCHKRQAAGQMASEMGLSVWRPAEARLLRAHPLMKFERGPYRYELRNQDGKVTFSVTDGKATITEPVYLVVGSDEVFQAYLVQHDGAYYRVAADYYTAQGKLGLDPEAPAAMPATLEGALGKRISAGDVRGCMGCHSPASVVGDRVETAAMTPGITCEVCHGPGAKHVAAMKAGKRGEAEMFNPAHLGGEAKTAFCDDCHTSADKMKEQKPQGVHGVVSPAYRLQMSRCWNATDPRLSCSACHSPHAPLVRELAAYDEKCLACHAVRGGAAARADQPGKTCPVGQKDCAGCHMPRVPVPGSPILFTDHRIRIAAAGAAYPE